MKFLIKAVLFLLLTVTQGEIYSQSIIFCSDQTTGGYPIGESENWYCDSYSGCELNVLIRSKELIDVSEVTFYIYKWDGYDYECLLYDVQKRYGKSYDYRYWFNAALNINETGYFKVHAYDGSGAYLGSKTVSMTYI